MAHAEDVRHIAEALNDRQLQLVLPQVVLRQLRLDELDNWPSTKKDKSHHNYFRATFGQEGSLAALFADHVRPLRPTGGSTTAAAPAGGSPSKPPGCWSVPAREEPASTWSSPSASDLSDSTTIARSDASTHAPRSFGERVLAPLTRTWFSTRLGRVVAPGEARVLLEGAWGETTAVLHLLWPTGAGIVHVVGRSMFLEAITPRGPGTFKFDPLQSNAIRGPVVWLPLPGHQETQPEVWHATLLDASLRAREHLAAEGVLPKLEVGPTAMWRELQPDTSPGRLSLAFCTTVKDRLWQLRHALPICLANNWRHRHWVRFYIVDFGSSDGALDFLLSTCREAIDAGLLRVYQAELPHFHASKAKNTAHSVAQEDILVNLDCDNLVDEDFAPRVRRRFEEDGLHALRFSGGQGTCGRICCLREDFLQLRGYDEECHAFGAQDLDFFERLQQRFGKPAAPVDRQMDVCAVPNKKADTIRLVTHLGMSWGQMDAANRAVFHARTASGQLVRNRTHCIGAPATRCFGGADEEEVEV